MRPLSCLFKSLALLLLFLASSATAQNGSHYVVIPNTTSPDGKYAMAWTARNASGQDIANWDLDSVENYLLDLKNKNPVATLGTTYFESGDFVKNHGSFSVSWRGDSKAVVFSEGGKWATLAAGVVYIVNPAKEWEPCSDVIPITWAAGELVRAELEKGSPEMVANRDFYVASFTPVQWVGDYGMTLDVLAEVPKSEEAPYFEKAITVTLPSPDTVHLTSDPMVSSPRKHNIPHSALTKITANSVGPVRLGLTVQEAMNAMPSATFSRTSDGEGIALILVQEAGESLMHLHAGEWDSNAPIDPTKKIEFIAVFGQRFSTEEGIHVGSLLSDGTRAFGGLQHLSMSEIESRKYAHFSNHPSGLHFQVHGVVNTAAAQIAGTDPDGTINPGAWISSIEVTGRQIMDDGSIGGIKLNSPQADLFKTASSMNFGEAFKGQDEIWEAFGQAVQTWMFPDTGASFDMISDEIGGPKSVFSITLKAPSRLKTGLGIGIGDPKEKVVQAYRDYTTSDEGLDGFFGDADAHLVGSIYGGMIFYFENGLVSEIFLGAAAE